MIKIFEYQGIKIDYSLIKDNRKTISITVYPNLSIELKTPISAENDRIENFLKRKIIWIVKQIDYFKKYKIKKDKEYISGESFLYLGRQYKLIVEKAWLLQEVKLSKGILNVFSHNPKSSQRTEELLFKWYNDRRSEVYLECLDKALEKFNYNDKFQIISRKMNKRWGSYSRNGNKITLNEDLIKASKEAIIYVITHELCHFTNNNHSKEFYSMLEKKIPNWKQIKEKLELRFVE